MGLLFSHEKYKSFKCCFVYVIIINCFCYFVDISIHHTASLTLWQSFSLLLVFSIDLNKSQLKSSARVNRGICYSTPLKWLIVFFVFNNTPLHRDTANVTHFVSLLVKWLPTVPLLSGVLLFSTYFLYLQPAAPVSALHELLARVPSSALAEALIRHMLSQMVLTESPLKRGKVDSPFHLWEQPKSIAAVPL